MKTAILVVSLITSPSIAYADDAGCEEIGAFMYRDLANSIVNDTTIDATQLSEKNAAVELLDVSPVSLPLAKQLATIDSTGSKKFEKDMKDFIAAYSQDGAKSITAKYTFTTPQGRKNVYIASSLFNKYECSLRFNGYLTLSREF